MPAPGTSAVTEPPVANPAATSSRDALGKAPSFVSATIKTPLAIVVLLLLLDSGANALDELVCFQPGDKLRCSFGSRLVLHDDPASALFLGLWFAPGDARGGNGRRSNRFDWFLL